MNWNHCQLAWGGLFLSPYLQSIERWPQGRSHTCLTNAAVHWNTKHNNGEEVKLIYFSREEYKKRLSSMTQYNTVSLISALTEMWPLLRNITTRGQHTLLNMSHVACSESVREWEFDLEFSVPTVPSKRAWKTHRNKLGKVFQCFTCDITSIKCARLKEETWMERDCGKIQPYKNLNITNHHKYSAQRLFSLHVKISNNSSHSIP